MASPAAALGEGLLLGIAASGHCLGLCAPALAPLVVDRGEAGTGPWRAMGAFLLCRLLGYAIVVTVAMSVGSALPDTTWVRRLAGGSMMVLAVLMIALGLRLNVPELRFCRWAEQWRMLERAPCALGLLIGLSPCPPLLLVCVRLAGGGEPAASVAFALAFVAATTALTAGIGLLGCRPVARRIAGFARAAALLSGLWFAAQAVTVLR